jgi:hypothetical protein
MNDGFPDDPGAPVFFVSYARPRVVQHDVAPAERNRHAMRFFGDLTAIVNELIPVLPGGDPGFMDMTMEGGERWEKHLLNAAGTCQVFIALLSGPYLRSEWCAMEWDVFSRRSVVRRTDMRPDTETGILPVQWVPIVGPIPPVVNDVNRFTPSGLPDDGFGAQYRRHGVYGLLQRGQENAYQSIIWALALRIQQLRHSHWVEPLIPPDTTGLHRTFDRGAP